MKNPLRYSILLVLILYASNLIPILNYYVSDFLNMTVIKLITVSLIVYVGTFDTLLALMLAICFILSLQMNAKNSVMVDLNIQPKPIMENMNSDNNPLGYNTQVPCLKKDSGCNSDLSAPCNAVAVFKDEENAQGLNCDAPNGYLNNMDTVSPF